MKQITLMTIKSMFGKTISKTMNYSSKCRFINISIYVTHLNYVVSLSPTYEKTHNECWKTSVMCSEGVNFNIH